jgi:1,4-alpha-glucan branching enzyme
VTSSGVPAANTQVHTRKGIDSQGPGLPRATPSPHSVDTREHAALHDDSPEGFSWIDFGDRDNSVVSYVRKGTGEASGKELVFVLNPTPVVRENYRVGDPEPGVWQERLNSDAETYGGSGVGNMGEVETTPVPYHGRPASLVPRSRPSPCSCSSATQTRRSRADIRWGA